MVNLICWKAINIYACMLISWLTKGATDLLPYIENEILDRGMDALLTSTGCMKQCDNGPVMVIYPENYWYGKVESEDAVDEILDALEDGETASNFLL